MKITLLNPNNKLVALAFNDKKLNASFNINSFTIHIKNWQLTTVFSENIFVILENNNLQIIIDDFKLRYKATKELKSFNYNNTDYLYYQGSKILTVSQKEICFLDWKINLTNIFSMQNKYYLFTRKISTATNSCEINIEKINIEFYKLHYNISTKSILMVHKFINI